MGLFNRKSTGRINTNGDSSSLAHSASSLKSPANGNGTSFTSPSMADIVLPGPPDPILDPAAYLRSIYAVRQRSRYIIVNAKRNQLSHFDVDLSKWKETAAYVVSIIKVGVFLHRVASAGLMQSCFTERLCPRFPPDSSPWPMAAF